MKLLSIFIALVSGLLAEQAKRYDPVVLPENMGVKEKKERFYALINPAVQRVHSELQNEFESTKRSLDEGVNRAEIERLKKEYSVFTDRELLLALKPHPQSIALAQAAMESSWATSRFFLEAKNIFGMWSANKNEPRIAASQKRGGTRTIWLRKFATIEDSIRAYYKLMAKGKAFKIFRQVRFRTNNPLAIVPTLNKYSEIGREYPKELADVIRFNNLQRFDIQ